MQNVPVALSLAFGLTTGLVIWLFCRAAPRSGWVLAGLVLWLLLQGAVAGTGFYTVTATLPPRLGLALGPPLLAIGLLVFTAPGRRFLDELRLEALTLLHVVRVPVELVLLALAGHGAVPRLMTLEGRNWDILTGLTAPLVYYLAFRRKQLGRLGLLIWNLAGLALVLNVVVNAVLAVPGPLQRQAFDQPNVAILHFPFVWLPALVVPLVLVAHLTAIRRLLGAPGPAEAKG